MRIIAGKFRAKVINSPKTTKTRPTLDRVKEALFSIIQSRIGDAKILDLFSGTGNLALESISRGASFAWMNDLENVSISTILSNVELTKSQNYVKITKKDYMKCLKQFTKENIEFDIIFLDPPYDSDYGIKALEYISNTKGVLAKDGIIIYETDKNFVSKLQKMKKLNLLDKFENLGCTDERNYGNVILRIYNWREK